MADETLPEWAGFGKLLLRDGFFLSCSGRVGLRETIPLAVCYDFRLPLRKGMVGRPTDHEGFDQRGRIAKPIVRRVRSRCASAAAAHRQQLSIKGHVGPTVPTQAMSQRHSSSGGALKVLSGRRRGQLAFTHAARPPLPCSTTSCSNAFASPAVAAQRNYGQSGQTSAIWSATPSACC